MPFNWIEKRIRRVGRDLRGGTSRLTRNVGRIAEDTIQAAWDVSAGPGISAMESIWKESERFGRSIRRSVFPDIGEFEDPYRVGPEPLRGLPPEPGVLTERGPVVDSVPAVGRKSPFEWNKREESILTRLGGRG